MKQFDLDTPLIELSENKGGALFTIRDAVEGCAIFGGIGSGKTTGSGRMFALKYLSHGFGGLVLTTKEDEREMWVEYCRLTNRSADLCIIEPCGKNHFNLIDYESSKKAGGIQMAENLVEVLKTVITANAEKSGHQNNDSFWETALDMLIFNVIDLCSLAYGRVSIQKMFAITISAPKMSDAQKNEQEKTSAGKSAFVLAFEAAHKKVITQVDHWENSVAGRKAHISKNDLEYENEMLDSIPDARLFKSIDQFFVENFRNLSEKTRSIIEFSFAGFLFRLLREPFYSLFCRYASTVTPDDCLDGKIILLNLPVKKFNKVGRDLQIMFKYIWQRAMEKRQIKLNERPVFLWADEAQNFIHEHDSEYQATARSSRIATVYISQNLPNYHSMLGGIKSEYRIKSFLGTLSTKIFHANADSETNHYASDLIGEEFVENLTNGNSFGKDFSRSSNISITLEKIIRPEEFARLKTGGPLNNYRVEGLIHRQGNTGNGKNHSKLSFNQNFKP